MYVHVRIGKPDELPSPAQEDLWRRVTRQVEQLSGRSVEPDLASRHFAEALIAPGDFSHLALGAALGSLGVTVSVDELPGSSTADLQRRTVQVCILFLADMGPV